MTSNAASAAGDDDNLGAAPVVLVRRPVVQGPVRPPAVDVAGDAEIPQRLDAREGLCMQDRQVLAAPRVLGGGEESTREERVEGDLGDQPYHGVASESLAGEQTVVHRHVDSSARMGLRKQCVCGSQQ